MVPHDPDPISNQLARHAIVKPTNSTTASASCPSDLGN